MPLFRSFLPEFSYLSRCPKLGRMISLVVAFAAFGLISFTSSLSLLMGEDEADARSAFALAPTPGPGREWTAVLVEQQPVIALAPKGTPPNPAASNPVASCQGGDAASMESSCAPVSEQSIVPPAAAALAPAENSVVETSASVVPPSAPAVGVAAQSPPDPETRAATEAAAAVVPAAAAVAPATEAAPAKPRKVARQGNRRYSQDPFLWPFGQPRHNYARAPFRLFW